MCGLAYGRVFSRCSRILSLELDCLIKVKYHSSKRSKAVLPYHNESSGYINDFQKELLSSLMLVTFCEAFFCLHQEPEDIYTCQYGNSWLIDRRYIIKHKYVLARSNILHSTLLLHLLGNAREVRVMNLFKAKNCSKFSKAKQNHTKNSCKDHQH